MHLSWGHPRRALPVILALWSPDFPHAALFSICPRLSDPVALSIVQQQTGIVKYQPIAKEREFVYNDIRNGSGQSAEMRLDMGSAFAEFFTSLRDKRILVLGLGVSNRPLVRLLLDFGCRVTGCDRTPREKLDAEILELEKLGCRLSVGGGYLDGLTADIVFRTPGMHPDHPALQDLRRHGAEVTSEMEVFFEVCPCRILAVTGSDGKTTTTTLISEMLKASGKQVWLGGNIGTPLLSFVPQMQPADIAVVELSSFQLMDMRRSPHVALITNLSPNHLDVHKDMAEYVAAKETVFRYQKETDTLIVNADNALTRDYIGPGRTLRFSRQGPVNGAWVENGVLYCRGEAVLRCDEILLPGQHNVENYLAAILAVEGFADREAVRKVAKTFGGVPHREELVRVKDGVRYYNDSIASSPSRTIAGLQIFTEKVILIAGGYDKHISYETLGPEICRHVKRLYLNGATAPQIRKAVEQAAEYEPGKPEIIDCGDFTAAVQAAAKSAQPGDVVLMSPASAAFDQFKNFEVRGNYFKKLVMEL